MKNGFLLLLIVFFFNSLTVSAQSWLWGRQAKNGLKDEITGQSIATNRTGNVYQTGFFNYTATFGPYSVHSQWNDAYLVKYDQNGNVLWLRQSKSIPKIIGTDIITSGALGYSVANDDSDNAYITGYLAGSSDMSTDTVGGVTLFGPDTLNQIGQPFIVKYDPNGNVVWAKQPFIHKGVNPGVSIATDKFGHEYVSGSDNYSHGLFLIKYDRNGNIVWTVTPTSTNPNQTTYGNSISTDISGNVYVSGTFQNSLLFGSYQLFSQNTGIFIAKFDSNGNVLWAQQSTYSSVNSFNFEGLAPSPFPNQGEDPPGPAISTDMSGAVYLTSMFTDTVIFNSYTFTNENFFVVKYNPGGTIAWGKEAPSLGNSGWGTSSICTDDSNRFYISGVGFQEQYGAFVFGNDTVSASGNPYMSGIGTGANNSSFLLKLDSSGKVLCFSTLHGGGNYFNAVASDPTGRFVYLGGIFWASFSIGNDSLVVNTGGDHVYVGRWQACECNLTVISGPTLQTICAGYSALLTASGSTNYTWSPAATLSSSTGDSVVASPLATTIYTVSTINAAGCGATSLDTIYVLEGVNIPIITQQGNVLITSSTNDNQWFRNDSILTGETGRTDTATVSGWYKVEAINPSNGCNTVSDSIYVKASGIAQLSINGDQLSVYPNPATGEIFLDISSSAEDVKDWNLQIANVLGQTVYTRTSLNYSNYIDLSGLPGGIYFIAVINKMGRTVAPVVKQ